MLANSIRGKGDENGSEALGDIDIKSSKRNVQDGNKYVVSIARYISKYISKSYLEHHQFNRNRYWAPRTIKLPETTGQWMRAQTTTEPIQEHYSRFDTADDRGHKREPIHLRS